MNGFESLLDKPVFQALGWTLIHFIWQGALIAIVYASVSVLLRRFSASVRYAAACGAMLVMLVAPVATMVVIGSNPGPDQFCDANDLPSQTPILPVYSAVQDEATAPPTPQIALSRTEQIARWAKERLPRAMPWLLSLWFAGVLFLSLRF